MNLHHPDHRPQTSPPPLPIPIPILLIIAGNILFVIWFLPKLHSLALFLSNSHEAVFYTNCLVICYTVYKMFRFFKDRPKYEYLEPDQDSETKPLRVDSIDVVTSHHAKEKLEESVSAVQSDDQSKTQLNEADDVIIDSAGDITIVVSPPETPPLYASETATTQTRRFRVSSWHLIHRSKYFEALMTNLSLEEKEIFAKGTLELCVIGTDPDTFSVLLHLLHSRQAPPLTTFPQFVTLAVQANYFQCEEALHHYPQRWLQDPISADSVDASWVFVAWMYRDAELFAKVTKILQQQRRGDFDNQCLPIPGIIELDINATKKESLAYILGIFSACLTDLQRDEIQCSDVCDSFKLGSLIRQLGAAGIYLVDVTSERYYDTHSVEDLLELVGQITDYDCIRRDANGCLCNPSGTCEASWKDGVSKCLEKYTLTPNGLTLQHYVDC